MFKPPTQLCHHDPFGDRAEVQALTDGTTPSSDANSPGWSDTILTLLPASSQPETTNSSNEQQICFPSQRGHIGSDHIISPTVSLSQRTSSSSLVQLVMLLFKV